MTVHMIYFDARKRIFDVEIAVVRVLAFATTA
jgi:hypothetical protein